MHPSPFAQLAPHDPQLLLSFDRFTHDPLQLTSLTGQQIPVPPFVLQFPFWHSWLFVHEPPSAVLVTQLPLPSQARFDPQVVPTPAGDWLHTGAPVLQLIVPGLHVVPHAAFAVQETVEAVPPVGAPPVAVGLPPPDGAPLVATALAPPDAGVPPKPLADVVVPPVFGVPPVEFAAVELPPTWLVLVAVVFVPATVPLPPMLELSLLRSSVVLCNSGRKR